MMSTSKVFILTIGLVSLLCGRAVSTNELEVTASYKSFPVVGEEATLMCKRSPGSIVKNNGRIFWKRGTDTLAGFHCMPEQDLCQKIDVTLADPSKYLMTTNGLLSANLTIYNLTKADNGKYECKVVDEFGLKEKTIRMLVSSSVAPHRLDMSANGLNFYDEDGGTSVNVLQSEPVSFSCLSFGSRPTAVISWTLENTSISNVTSYKSQMNEIDPILMDVKSTIEIIPTREFHMKDLRCLARAGDALKETKVALHVNGPPDEPRISDNGSYFEGSPIEFTCSANNGWPAPSLEWFMLSPDSRGNYTLMDSTQMNFSDPSGRIQASSELTIIPTRNDHEKELVCRVVWSMIYSNSSVWTSEAVVELHITSFPDPVSTITINNQQTTTTSLIVSWQPGFVGNLQQTFTLSYCVNETNLQEDCINVTALNGNNHTLSNLISFTKYRIAIVSRNEAGQSTKKEIIGSTAPLSPTQYGIIATLDQAEGVLSLSEPRRGVTLPSDLCFLLLPPNNTKAECPSQDAECNMKSGSQLNVELTSSHVVIVSFGRGLCSEPTYPRIVYGGKAYPFLYLMLVAGSVVVGSVLILFISSGVIWIHKERCSTDKKKGEDQNEVEIVHVEKPGPSQEQRQGADAPEPKTLSNGRMVDDDGLIYIDVSHEDTEHPLDKLTEKPTKSKQPTVYAAIATGAMKMFSHQRTENPKTSEKPVKKPTRSEGSKVCAAIALEAMKKVQEKKKDFEDDDRMPSFYVNYGTPTSPDDKSIRYSRAWDDAVLDYF